VVDPFDLTYKFADSKVSLSVPDDFSVSSVDMLEESLVILLRFANNCKEVFGNISRVLSAMRPQVVPCDIETDQTNLNPISVSCSSAAGYLRTARMRFNSLKDCIALNEEIARLEIIEKNDELDLLRKLVFLKEQERLSAITMVSSQASGWLRIGSARHSRQRGFNTCVWPHWVILRQSLMFLYPGPCEVSSYYTEALSGPTLRCLLHCSPLSRLNSLVSFP
jgi:hypothetical protein